MTAIVWVLVYFSVGIIALGLKRYWMKREGVTPEFLHWWRNFYNNHEGHDAWEYLQGFGYSRCNPAPHPRPPKRPYSTRWFYNNWLIALFWPIILPVVLIILTLIHVYTKYPREIAEWLDRRIGNGSRLD